MIGRSRIGICSVKAWVLPHIRRGPAASARAKFSTSETATTLQPYFKEKHPQNNVTDSIITKVDHRLHLRRHHPLNIIKKKIEEYCNGYAKSLPLAHPDFQLFDSLSPIVDTKSCFDDLRVEPDHVSRKPSDTYYLDESTVLRTHTSAHQCHLMRSGHKAFLCSGDVYRRDEIDSSHYPVFHQMEGVRIYDACELPDAPNSEGTLYSDANAKFIENDLKHLLTGLAHHLFGNDIEIRWRDDYFPFTEPSFELEIFFQGDWLEVLGCGVIHPEVLGNADLTLKYGWAFGLGLERLAMVLFDIPDIRLFWSTDERFTSQFTDGKITKFIPYSKYPPCYKDVSFWIPSTNNATIGTASNVSGEARDFHVNDVYEVIRNVAGDWVEKVELFDEFTHKKTGRQSQAYRIIYRHMDRSLTNKEVDEVQLQVRASLVDQLAVELR